ncbi:formate dehydrogenase accessory sulfurtransferase FdhD [Lentibacillus sp. CBA3610]|uniref:formate dehydrogenase accessory sulfurtransferase FdhD n=1 Tax=Lentibacillus sp. CBA3610 TaxID=2518176 RepID=UPI001595F1DA|nr:formate dehydrogenase accessory sulfurtransferase FdhD [Lentibacillus sp. CBA3610]QKY68849.1 formate dehydrogenase accessory sulfurtransferase FdhD [Lentibacillus sp. CBA3610]
MDYTVHDGWRVIRFNGSDPSPVNDEVATEFPLTVMINGEEFATMVCSPTDLEELVIGFLASEGIIRFYDEINHILLDEAKGFAYVDINKTIDSIQQDHSKRFIGSCCGKSRQFYFKSDVNTAKTIYSRLSISVDQCYALMGELQAASEQFLRTGGVHNAALATPDEMLAIRTDIGRHNALDKIYGHIFQERLPVKHKLIVFSGRVSSEVLLKISKIGAGILLSKSAPTDLALQLADDLGITVIGFVRQGKMNVYTHPQRILEVNSPNSVERKS